MALGTERGFGQEALQKGTRMCSRQRGFLEEAMNYRPISREKKINPLELKYICAHLNI